MKLNKDKSYIFLNGNKHGLITHLCNDAFMNDPFSIIAETMPDYDHMDETLKGKQWDHQVIVGKNGKHIGLCFYGYIDENGINHYGVSFEWWQSPDWDEHQNPDLDEIKTIRIEVPRDTPLKLVLEKNKGEFMLDVNGTKGHLEYNNIIDYTNSFMWIGCGSRLFKNQHTAIKDGSIYYGEIKKLHIEDGLLLSKDKELFFKDFDTFIYYFTDVHEKKVYFSSNFSDVSLYKIRDHSNNSNHALLFSEEWLDI